MCTVPTEPEGGIGFPGLGLTATWVLGTEPQPSGRAASALSGQALSPAPLSQPLVLSDFYILIIIAK